MKIRYQFFFGQKSKVTTRDKLVVAIFRMRNLNSLSDSKQVLLSTESK